MKGINFDFKAPINIEATWQSNELEHLSFENYEYGYTIGQLSEIVDSSLRVDFTTLDGLKKYKAIIANVTPGNKGIKSVMSLARIYKTICFNKKSYGEVLIYKK